MSIEGLTKVIQDEFRVVADVDAFLIEDKPDELVRRCKQLQAEIERHCDSYKHVYWEHNTREVCVFCEEEWKGCVDDNGYPCCCEKAQEKADELGIEPAPDTLSDKVKIDRLAKSTRLLLAHLDMLEDAKAIPLGTDHAKTMQAAEQVLKEAEGHD